MTDMVEISKAELEALNKAKGLLDKLWQDKDSGLDFKKMVKKAIPDSNIPELDIMEKVTKPLEEKIAAYEKMTNDTKEEFTKFKKELKDKDEESAFSAQLDRVRKENSFTDDGWKKVIDRMKEKNNPDVEAAAAFIKSQEPKPQVAHGANYVPGKIDLFGSATKDTDWELLHRNPDAFFENTVNDILNNPAEAA